MTSVESSTEQIGLVMNAKKTKVMAYNEEIKIRDITRDGSQLEVVQDFKYLGSCVHSTENDIKIRKGAKAKEDLEIRPVQNN